MSARSPRVRAARGLADRGDVHGATCRTARGEEGGEAETDGAIHPSSSVTGTPRAFASFSSVASEGLRRRSQGSRTSAWPVERRQHVDLRQGVPRSLNHPIRLQQERRRDGQAEGLGGLEINDHVELARVLDREVGGFGAFQDLTDVLRSEPE